MASFFTLLSFPGGMRVCLQSNIIRLCMSTSYIKISLHVYHRGDSLSTNATRSSSIKALHHKDCQGKYEGLLEENMMTAMFDQPSHLLHVTRAQPPPKPKTPREYDS